MRDSQPKDGGKGKKPGPKEYKLKVHGIPWKDAIAKAIETPKPKAGWPDPPQDKEDSKETD